MKILKSPPPQNPTYHKIKEIIPTKNVKIIENKNILKLLDNVAKNKLNPKPLNNRLKLNLLGIIPNFKS